jgi:CO/xanthine dehydrogenase Mo-binding subunit
VFCGSIDIGQGSDSVLAYVVAEVLGIRPEDVRVVTADTDLTPVDLGSYSSRVTLMTGNAAREAAEKLRLQLLGAAAKKLEASPEDLVARDRRIFVRGDPGRGLAFDEAARLAEAAHGTLVAAGSYTPPRRAAKFKGSGVGPTPAYSYSACAVEVTVDPDTGDVRVDRVWVAHDGGTAINPLLVEGQVEGSIYMGLGEALMEESAFRVHGLHKIPSLLEYKSPTTLETPEITTLLVETRDPEGPFGAKEAGQGPLLPVIPAVANAVYDAVGVRIDEVPITPEKVLKALDRKAQGKAPRVGPERLPHVVFPEPIRVPPPWVDPEGRAAAVVHGPERPGR